MTSKPAVPYHDHEDGQIAFKVFKVSDAINQVEAKCKKASFDKRHDASETGTARSESMHCVPCLLISCLAWAAAPRPVPPLGRPVPPRAS